MFLITTEDELSTTEDQISHQNKTENTLTIKSAHQEQINDTSVLLST